MICYTIKRGMYGIGESDVQKVMLILSLNLSSLKCMLSLYAQWQLMLPRYLCLIIIITKGSKPRFQQS